MHFKQNEYARSGLGNVAMRLIRTDDDIAAGLDELLARDPRLVPVRALAGPIPLRRAEADFAGLAAIIVAQMISKAAAAVIWTRMEQRLGTVTAEAMFALTDEDRRACGLSTAKAIALKTVAHAVVEDGLDLSALCDLEGRQAVSTLCALPGIGPWTAEVFLLVCAGHPDVFPAGDVALQAALADALALEKRPGARETALLAAAWSPFRSVAARLFWAYYTVRTGRGGTPQAP